MKNKKIYNTSNIYNPKTISKLPDTNTYADNMLRIKLNIISKYLSSHHSVLDLGCATGIHLINIASKIKFGIGVDFSARFIKHANTLIKYKNIQNLKFINTEFEKTRLPNESIDLVYSLSSLYYVLENIETIFKEIARVLRKGGIVILDLGNARSLNKLVCDSTPKIAKILPYTIEYLIYNLRQDFFLLEHRCFQIFPMWGNNPWYLKPVLTRLLPTLLKVNLFGKMLDERLSSLPIIKYFAFRHILVLKKQ